MTTMRPLMHKDAAVKRCPKISCVCGPHVDTVVCVCARVKNIMARAN